MIAAALLLAQAAPGTPQSFSILADPCKGSSEEEVVVCGRARERMPATDPDAAVDPPAAPCTGSMSGCWVGVDLIGPAVKVARLVGDLAKRGAKTDKTGRVPIDLDAPSPGPVGRVGR